MPAGALWNSFFQGNRANIRKGLYGSVLIRDYAQATTSLTGFSPFNSTDGNFVTTLLSGSNPWTDIGYLDESGPKFAPKLTTELTKVMQTRRPVRADYTEDSEEISFTLMESNGVTDALTQNKPLSDVIPIGSTAYAYGRPVELDLIYRQLLCLLVDSTGSNTYYAVRAYPCVTLTSIGTRSWNPKKPDSVEVKFQSFPDPYTVSNDGVAGAPLLIFRDGPGWRTQGSQAVWPIPQTAPVATAVTGAKATVALAVPTGPGTTFTYEVIQTLNGVPTLSTLVGSPTGSPTVTITVGSLTIGSNYTFNVIATPTNGIPSVQSMTSNSITAIA